jgi:ABC-2 type transport system permease protein
MMDSAPGLRVACQDEEPSQGLRRLSRGEVYALVLFPNHLERDVVKGRSPSVGVYVNGQMLLPAGLVSRDLRQALGTLAAGVKIQVRRKTGETRRQAMDRYDPVRLESHALFVPELDYRRFLVPALVAALLQIFAMFAAIRALGLEIKLKTAGLWFRHAGKKTAPALFGKMLPYAVLHSLLSLVLLLFWHGPMGNPVAGSFAAEWGALSAMGWTAEAIALFIVGWTADYRLSLSMGAFFGGPSMAFAGVTFPTAAMNGPALGWSSMLPLTHAIRVIVDQSVRGASLRADAVPFLALAGLGLFFTGVTWKRWGRVLTDRSEWGQS